MTKVVVVAAVARNGVIGDGPDIPWHIPGDFAHFKRLTMGHTLIMGRVTYCSIGRPLPGRRTIVLTRNPLWQPEHRSVTTARSVPQAVSAVESGTAFVCGGAGVYAEAMPIADELVISHIPLSPVGDVRFPPIDHTQWDIAQTTEYCDFTVVRYLRPKT